MVLDSAANWPLPALSCVSVFRSPEISITDVANSGPLIYNDAL
jgi:hypothetical protein